MNPVFFKSALGVNDEYFLDLLVAGLICYLIYDTYTDYRDAPDETVWKIECSGSTNICDCYFYPDCCCRNAHLLC